MAQFEPIVSNEDIAQECWIVRLQGKDPSKAIVNKKLWRQALDHPNLDSDEDETFFTKVQAEIVHTAEEELIAWALEQNDNIQSIIDKFLNSDEPEDILDDILDNLRAAGVKLNWFRTPQRSALTYSEIMLKALPASKDDLIKLMSRFPIKRPASTVRQFLRRNAPNLYVNERGEYDRL